MGFVYNLHCDTCGFVERHVTIGIAAGHGSTLSIIQDQQSGAIRQIGVTNSDIERHSTKADIASDDEWFAAMNAYVESQLSEFERQIAPHQAFCPRCREPLRSVSVGIS